MIISICLAIMMMISMSIYEIRVYKVDLFETIPTNLCFINLLLYAMAFFNCLNFISFIELMIVVCVLIKLIIFNDMKKNRIEFGKAVFVITIVLFITVGMRNRVIAGWDDYKFWAAQVKALFFCNGYGRPYSNIVPAFGDYPMGTLLIEWWFESINGQFSESILYIGQMLYSVAFLLPMLKKIKISIWNFFPLIVLVIAFGSIFTRFGIGLEPDRTMAFAYGAALISAYNLNCCEKEKEMFYKVQFLLFLMTISIMKSIGIFWSISALGLYLVLPRNVLGTKCEKAKTGLIYFMILAVEYFSWIFYCYIFDRKTEITQVMISSMGYSWVEIKNRIFDNLYILRMFLETLFLRPMNCSNFYVGTRMYIAALPPVFLLSIALIICILFIKKQRELKFVVAYNGMVAVLYGIVLLWSYYFMFYSELPDSTYIYHLQNMTSHYYEPAICGAFMMAIYILFKNIACEKTDIVVWCLLLLTNVPMTYNFSFNSDINNEYYEISNEEKLLTGKKIESLVEFINKSNFDDNDVRLLICVNTDSEIDYLGFCMLHYNLSPLSTIEYKVDDLDDNMFDYAKSNHCKYIIYNEEGKWQKRSVAN